MSTHDVLNQPPPLIDYNLFTADRALVEALRREGGAWAEEQVSAFGRLMGTPEALRRGFDANEHTPELRTHDRFGNRIDAVEFHPAWHEVLRTSVEHSIHSLPWRDARDGAHVARAALFMLASQMETGHLCPISMTYSIVPVLRRQPALAEAWEPKIRSNSYDPRFLPAGEKTGVLLGMAMTEKQGGSDVRANTSRATALGAGGPGGEYAITGHKWFTSAPMCDAFLVLAQAPGGLSCFLMPRWTPEGKLNAFHLQRLKDKLGNRSNASSEVEFDGARAVLVGEEGRGVPTIIEMVSHTRLDCVLISTGNMRQAVAQATHHAAHRSAFKRRLEDHPLMQNVLADLCVESEAATMLSMRLARAFDRRQDKDFEGPFQRLAMAISKFWVCKRAPSHVVEAMECLGGNGYVEESILPRLYREMPLYSIWEGCGNVNCLDVLRAMSREPASLEAVLTEIRAGRGADSRLDAAVREIERDLTRLEDLEGQARRFTERLALALQGSLLVRFGDKTVADAFCATRLARDWGYTFGTLPAGTNFKHIIDRSRPS
jgi:putative acyl-CoA dehydrogenase